VPAVGLGEEPRAGKRGDQAFVGESAKGGCPPCETFWGEQKEVLGKGKNLAEDRKDLVRDFWLSQR